MICLNRLEHQHECADKFWATEERISENRLELPDQAHINGSEDDEETCK